MSCDLIGGFSRVGVVCRYNGYWSVGSILDIGADGRLESVSGICHLPLGIGHRPSAITICRRQWCGRGRDRDQGSGSGMTHLSISIHLSPYIHISMPTSPYIHLYSTYNLQSLDGTAIIVINSSKYTIPNMYHSKHIIY